MAPPFSFSSSTNRPYVAILTAAYLFFGGELSVIMGHALAVSVFPIHLAMTATVGLTVHYLSLALFNHPVHGATQNPSTRSTQAVDWNNLSGDNDRDESIVVDWPQPASTRIPPTELIGRFDPVDGTPLRQGEEIQVCCGCSTGYHIDSWNFLVQQNSGTCVSCQSRPGVYSEKLGQSESGTVPYDYHLCPQCRTNNRVPSDRPRSLARCGSCQARLFSSVSIVRLDHVGEYVGQIVLFEGLVIDSYRTNTGTIFVKFQKGHVENVFKLVIYKEHAHRCPLPQTYKDKMVRVHGLIQHHSRWGLEIVIKDPSSIQVMTY